MNPSELAGLILELVMDKKDRAQVKYAEAKAAEAAAEARYKSLKQSEEDEDWVGGFTSPSIQAEGQWRRTESDVTRAGDEWVKWCDAFTFAQERILKGLDDTGPGPCTG